MAMWANLTTAWNAVGEVAASATASLMEGAETAVSEAGRLAQTTKLHAEIALAQQSIDSLKRTWGFEAYDAMVAGDMDAVNAVLHRCKQQIDELNSQIALKNRQIEELEEEENPEDVVVLPPDGAASDRPAGTPPRAPAPAVPAPSRVEQQRQALLAASVAAAVPVATMVSPQDDAGFQEIGLSSPPVPPAAAADPAPAPAPAPAADPLGAAEPAGGDDGARDGGRDSLEEALLEADEALGPPPVGAPPMPAASGPSAEEDKDLDDELREIMNEKTP